MTKTLTSMMWVASFLVKVGINGLPIDIDQLSIDVFYNFYHSSKRTQECEDNWRDLFTTEADAIL